MKVVLRVLGVKKTLALQKCEVAWLADRGWSASELLTWPRGYSLLTQWSYFGNQIEGSADNTIGVVAAAYEAALRQAVLKGLSKKGSDVSHVEIMHILSGLRPNVTATVFRFDGGRNERRSGHPAEFKSSLHFWRKTAQDLHIGPWRYKRKKS